MKYLIVVDMQNDFIDGALGTPEAVSILPYVKSLISNFEGNILFTRDTHYENYMSTLEGKNLPVPHCIFGTEGWKIHPELCPFIKHEPINKTTFGSVDLVKTLSEKDDIEEITFVGLCTDICVISNVLLVKASFPDVPITVDAMGCAGVTPKSHITALSAMKMCHIKVINE